MNITPLRLLLAEDSDDDALLVLGCLERRGYEVECTRVMTAEGFRAALEGGDFEIILCDYSMPGFDAMEALEILHGSGRDIPLIIVSGTIGEHVAVDAMRHGAADYLLKDNLIRLGAAVEREVRESDTRRQKRLFDSFSGNQTEVLEMILNEEPLARSLERLTGVVETLSPNDVICSILLVNPEGTHLVLGAGPRLPDGLFEPSVRIPVAIGDGTCGTAARRGERVEIPDITQLPPDSEYRRQLASHGIQATWSVPIFSSDQSVIGTIGLLHRKPHTPTPEELHWVVSVSKLASLAIERSRAAEKLVASETLLRVASESARIGGWILDFKERRAIWSDQVCAIHDLPPGSSPDFDAAMSYCAPECRHRFVSALDSCRMRGEAFDEELRIITATGRSVWVRAIGRGAIDEDGAVIRIQGAFQDITAKKQTEEANHANERRYLDQRNALIALTRDVPSDSLEIAAAFHRITEISAQTLNVARVSIWKYTSDRRSIECLDFYNLTTNEHSSGMTLVADDYPAYFQSLSSLEFIAADDAINDPITREFAESFLKPRGITSSLDVPIHLHNRVDHLLSCEHVGPVRKWTADEKTYAVAVANHISLALESRERALAQQEVARSHQLFQSVAAATNDTIWDWNLETNAFWWNDGFANLFGWSATDTVKTIHAWIRQIHPEDCCRVMKGVYAAIEGRENHWADEYRFISNDGSVSHVLDRGQIIRDFNGKGVRMVGGMTDLTASRTAEFELARSHRALRMLSSCNEMLVRTTDEAELLAEACRIAVEIGGYRMAWVGYAMDDERRSIKPMVHAGEESGYLSEIMVSWDGNIPAGRGPVGQSIRNGDTVVFEDLMGNSSFADWIAPARDRGYRHAVCLPLRDENRTFGMIGLYGAEPHLTGTDEVKMLREMADNLSFGIRNIRSREERRRTEETVVKVARAVSSGTGSEFFDLLVRNMVEALGARGGLIGTYDRQVDAIDSISYFVDGRLAEQVRYDLAGTPCAEVVKGDLCVFEQSVQQAFPSDQLLVDFAIESYAGIPLFNHEGCVTGIMSVFFPSPLKEISLVRSILRIFAARAASELHRQQADQRIRDQASLLDKAQDAILVRDLDHSITYWNQSAQRLYGWTAGEAIGRTVTDLLYQDTAEFHQAHEATLRNGEWVGEMRQIDKDGRELTIEGRWTLVRDDSGKPRSVFVINTDISERRRLEQQFLRAQRLESIGTLAGGIAHDLNNILAPISMAVELLRMQSEDDRSRELLDAIASSTKRGANMVGQVLSFARGVEGCRTHLHPRPLIHDLEGILRDTFPRNITLELVADEDLWTINADPTQIHQVLLNLCVNARDAINGPGRIRVEAENVHIDASVASVNPDAHEGPHLCIRVEDDGEGITPDVLDKIFDPFFTTKSIGKGTGLGLPTSLTIVKSHGGFIHTTTTPGAGTCFRIYIPALTEQDAPQDPPNQLEDIRQGRGEVILFVDDEKPIREIACRTLESFGYQVIPACHGQEAVDLYTHRSERIDVVVTDMMMPVMDGPESIRRLVGIDPSVRIIVTSGIAPHRDLGANVKDFLQKPYSAEALVRSLGHVLGNGVEIR